jgi:hypothetical protein
MMALKLREMRFVASPGTIMSVVSKVIASTSTNLTDFKANPGAIIEQSDGEAIAEVEWGQTRVIP